MNIRHGDYALLDEPFNENLALRSFPATVVGLNIREHRINWTASLAEQRCEATIRGRYNALLLREFQEIASGVEEVDMEFNLPESNRVSAGFRSTIQR